MPGGIYIPPGGGSGGAPSGTAGGGLSGTYPNPTLANPYYRQGANGAETTPRSGNAFGTATAIGAAGVMTCYAIDLYSGMTITSISFKTGGTAAVTPVNWWVALYDTSATPALLKQSADQLTTAIGATTAFTLNLSSTQAITTNGTYYVCLMVNAGTQPTLAGVNVGAAYSTGLTGSGKILAGTSGTALTGTAPGTIASLAAITGQAYMVTA